MEEIRTLSSRTVYANAWMTVREDAIERSDGRRGVYGVVDKPDFVLVVPYENGGLHLVEQYRYPVRQRLWELPQGVWGGPDADPLEAAAHELAEETGLRAGRQTVLGRLHEAYGMSSQAFHVVLAEDLTPGEQALEPEEVGLVSSFFALPEVWSLVDAGRLTDAPTLAALALLERHLARR